MWLTVIFTLLLFKASAARISGGGSETAVYGGEANYRCTLDNPTGVLQVTWQRLFKGDDSIENMATYSNRFGQQVNEPYKGKVVFTEASLSSTSITVKNLTWADESCYICSFNAYPEGSKSWPTCLTVQGISEVKTQAREEDPGVVFSCSATGKPAPTIDWDISAGAVTINQSETSVLKNSDRTLTSSRNITLRLPPEWNGHVDCVLNQDQRGRQQQRIPFTQTKEKNKNKEQPLLVWIVLPIMFVVFLLAIAVVAKIRKKRTKADGGTGNML
ncbi:OX-2 membrane glycoprotein-like [Sphaeramia orbicularis]|uniref:OX-2 membrane glycoprotein-like n=1 Tax=Sphaeramia orbicularis TaxID=375764 RepID=UPI00117E1620|nr:OX-2 membrane glycoprotein-like [Sphaeramia orbicularis]